MLIKICVLLIVFAAVTINAAPSDPLRNTRDISPELRADGTDYGSVQVSDSEWEEFKIKYNKTYTDSADETERRGIYLDTKKYVIAQNKKHREGKTSFKATINRLADRKPFEKRIGGFIRC